MQNINLVFGVVEAAGSSPVTQTKRKWRYYEEIRKSPFLFLLGFLRFGDYLGIVSAIK